MQFGTWTPTLRGNVRPPFLFLFILRRLFTAYSNFFFTYYFKYLFIMIILICISFCFTFFIVTMQMFKMIYLSAVLFKNIFSNTNCMLLRNVNMKLDNAVDIVTRLRDGRYGIQFMTGTRDFLFSKTTRLTLGSTCLLFKRNYGPFPRETAYALRS